MGDNKTKLGLPPAVPAFTPPATSGVRSAVADAASHQQIFREATSPSRGTTGRPPNRSTIELGVVLQECYQLREVLGRGGMGSVYAALDLNLNRSVAIKIPSTAAAANMMRQEAQAMAAFSHRGLPTVFALGTHAEWPYIVMERIRGRTLEAAIEDAAPHGGLPVQQAIHWISQLIDVVGVLHEANLAHRDLKPENVMLAPGDRLVLLDLGIVRQERFIGEEQTVTGSPHYMAPETVRGAVRVGQAHLVDIYSLGVTAYQALTGAWPYDSESHLEIMHMHMGRPVPRVSEVRQVPPLLDDIVYEMMAKDPAERPPSIDAVSEIFNKLKEGHKSLRRRPRV